MLFGEGQVEKVGNTTQWRMREDELAEVFSDGSKMLMEILRDD